MLKKELKLKPCPFCGYRERVFVTVRLGQDGWRDSYYVLCDYYEGGCGASGGVYHTEEEAVEAWNRRAKDVA